MTEPAPGAFFEEFARLWRGLDHATLVGRTRMGKSSLFYEMAFAAIAAGQDVAFVTWPDVQE